MNKKRIYFFVGTTAELIKLAPIAKEFNRKKIKFKFISSGQSPVRFEDLSKYTANIKSDISFKQKGAKSSLLLFALWIIRTFFTSLFSLKKEFKNLNKSNSYFFVHGDTVSSLLGALIAKIYNLKLVHIESGLRSFNFLEPFPEEICRYIIIHLADILFAPTEWALSNLKGVKGKKYVTYENTLIEACNWALKSKPSTKLTNGERYYILTMHRQEHVLFKKEWTKKIMKFVIRNSHKNISCILVTHHLTSAFFKNFNPEKLGNGKVRMIPRISYIDFINLMKNSEYIATDGCTNQEEAYYMGLPLLALRNLTERIEGVGQNIVISKNNNRAIKKFLTNYKKYRRKPIRPSIRPSKIIVDTLLTL